ncbi:hypothetical protein D3C78_1673330 [compost metagenome]
MLGAYWPRYQPLGWLRSSPPWNAPTALGEISPCAMLREGVVPSVKSKSPSWRFICWACDAGLKSSAALSNRRGLVMVSVLEGLRLSGRGYLRKWREGTAG